MQQQMQTVETKEDFCKTENFVEQYYSTSTFHHLSTWKLRFQQMVSELIQTQPTLKRKGTESSDSFTQDTLHDGFSQEWDDGTLVATSKSQVPQNRIILHVDLDSFYVSV